jgi:hypothetical protein
MAEIPTSGAPEWMTLRECANDVKVPVSIVREWCLRAERGEPGGLRSAHFGAKPPEDGERKSRRVHVDDWIAFRKSRSIGDASIVASIAPRAFVECIPEYRSRAARRAAVAREREVFRSSR